MEQRKGEQRTVRTGRPLLAGFSYVCKLLAFLLFSFPNDCDNTAYGNIALYAYSKAPDRPTAGPPCTVPPTERQEPRCSCRVGTGTA